MSKACTCWSLYSMLHQIESTNDDRDPALTRTTYTVNAREVEHLLEGNL